MKFRNGRKQLLVACGDDAVIDVIDVATLAVIDHVPTGANPEFFELSLDDKALYVSNKAESAVQVISMSEKLIEKEIPTGAGPGGIAVSGDEKTLYVASEISDWVHVVDLRAAVVTENIVVGTPPRRLFLVADELWVLNELSGQVSIIDRATNHVSANLDFSPPGFGQGNVTPLGIATTNDSKIAFVSLGQANIEAIVNTATRKIEHYVSVGRCAGGVALSADEKTLYVANALTDDVSIVDVANHEVIKAVLVGRAPHSVQADDLTNGPPTLAAARVTD
jgi:YVTN family beta-propeller protein